MPDRLFLTILDLWWLTLTFQKISGLKHIKLLFICLIRCPLMFWIRKQVNLSGSSHSNISYFLPRVISCTLISLISVCMDVMLMWSVLSRILAVIRIRWSCMLWLAILLALLYLISGVCGSLSNSRLLVLMMLYLMSPNSIIQLIPHLGKKTYLLSNGQPHKPTPHTIFCLLPHLDQPHPHLRGCQPLLWWRI